MQAHNLIHIGTSGWHYDHWKGPFYPEALPSDKMLGFYAGQFRTAEINNTFYQLPSADTLANWRETVPEHFLFAVKASRYITHMKKLKDAETPVLHFMERIRLLGPRLGPILFQLPPHWSCNAGRLEAFLGQLPKGERYAFEFRDQSWFNDCIYELLRRTGAAFCIYQLAGMLSPREVTAGFVYLRLHGPGDAYQGSYDSRTLAEWADAIANWAGQGQEIFCFFDNDQQGYAAQNAMQLKDMLSKGT